MQKKNDEGRQQTTLTVFADNEEEHYNRSIGGVTITNGMSS